VQGVQGPVEPHLPAPRPAAAGVWRLVRGVLP
jgi:hypothetical protein